MTSFSPFELLPTLLETLKEKGLKRPTEIQSKAIPLLMTGKSVVGVSETGSGKTLAYALPILHALKTLELNGTPITQESRPRAAVIIPSRELGEQVTRALKPFTHTTRLRVRSVLGGTEMEVAKKNCKGCFEVLVATPGRLIQLMEKGHVHLDDVRILVFDEADQMLDPSFLSEAQKIADACAPQKQLSLFSATVSVSIEKLMHQLFSQAEVIRTVGSHQLVPTLTTKNMKVIDGERFPVLEKILAQPNEGGTLIFANTREQCDTIAQLLNDKGYDCLIYRGEMDKLERRANLKNFRDGKNNLLIATDLASRGLDVEHVGRVINYHLPREIENYLHRAGRTARAGREGLVINLVTERDEPLMADLNRIQSRAK